MILVDEISKRTNLSRADVRRVLNAQQDICAEKLAKGEGVNMLGLGIKRNQVGNGYSYRVFVGNKLRKAVEKV